MENFCFSKSQPPISILSPNQITNVSLNELLDSLGFDKWKTLTAKVVFPIMSLLGILFSLLSLRVFCKTIYTQSNTVFFYYRLLCLVHFVHSFHHLPFSYCFSPGHFPSLHNSYSCSVYLGYNIVASSFMFHFEETLQIGILLNRMKTFSPFVKRHFNLTPQHTSLVFFITCLVIKIPLFFGFKIVPIGDYYYNGAHFIYFAKYHTNVLSGKSSKTFMCAFILKMNLTLRPLNYLKL